MASDRYYVGKRKDGQYIGPTDGTTTWARAYAKVFPEAAVAARMGSQQDDDTTWIETNAQGESLLRREPALK